MADVNLTANASDVVNDINQVNAAIDDLNQNANETTRAGNEMKTSWTEAFAKFSFIKEIASKLWEWKDAFHETNLEIRQQRVQLESLRDSVNFVRIQKQFEGLSDSLGNLATEQEKLNIAFKLSNSQFIDAEANLSQFGNAATIFAQRSGKEINEVLEKLVDAVAEGNAGMLEEYGIVLNVNDAIIKYASSQNKLVSELTDVEQKQVNSKLAFDAINEVVGNSKPIQDKYISTTKEMNSTFQDLKSTLVDVTNSLFGVFGVGMKTGLSQQTKLAEINKRIVDINKEKLEINQLTSGGQEKYNSLIVEENSLLQKRKETAMDFAKLQGAADAKSILAKEKGKQLDVTELEAVTELNQITDKINLGTGWQNEQLNVRKSYLAALIVEISKAKKAENELLDAQRTQRLLAGKDVVTKPVRVEPTKFINFGFLSEIPKQLEKTEAEISLNKKNREQLEMDEKINNLIMMSEIERAFLLSNVDLKNKIAEDELNFERKKEAEKFDLKKEYQDREEALKQIGWQTLQTFASESYEAMFSEEAEFNKKMVGRAFAYAGSQLWSMGIVDFAKGMGMLFAGNPGSAPMLGLSAAEIAGAGALGFAGKSLGGFPSADNSKASAASDRNQINQAVPQNQKIEVFNYPEEKYWLRSIQNANNKLEG